MAACMVFALGCAGHRNSSAGAKDPAIGTEGNWQEYDADGWQKLMPCGEWCSYEKIPTALEPGGSAFHRLSSEAQQRISNCEGRCRITLDQTGKPVGITMPGKLGSHGTMSFLLDETFWTAFREIKKSGAHKKK